MGELEDVVEGDSIEETLGIGEADRRLSLADLVEGRDHPLRNMEAEGQK